MSVFIIGLDLGQANDLTAITVLEREVVPTGKTKEVTTLGSSVYDGITGKMTGGTRTEQVPITENHYRARHLERLPIGTPYPQQVERVRALHADLRKLPAFKTTKDGLQAPVVPNVALVVDQTGVGRPITDMLRAAGLKPVAVTITGGDNVTRDGLDYRVPKRDLVSTAQVLLQSKRLRIAPALAEAQTLINELLAFKVTISASGHDRYGNDQGAWRENPHDDLVLSLALACWWGERAPAPSFESYESRRRVTAR